MELSEVEIVKHKYTNEVIPAIENKDYELAALALSSALFVTRGKEEKIILETHSGLGFLGSAKLLEDKLREGNEGAILRAKRYFEAYAAQTTLPL